MGDMPEGHREVEVDEWGVSLVDRATEHVIASMSWPELEEIVQRSLPAFFEERPFVEKGRVS